ncbi:MogA/MoaB family molybdenum cofactor biosynthesis protein [Lederbergia graminis]|uniref:Molybdenum cofactor biosynthesis protein B n=1 Tax=Lederbergia graminis TaxID=735518 RepID=A0ABW0LF54_9BACI|nr:MogA/MoaB family molybdenum cofactor biosynthesis protein [Paenibacillus bovis]HLU21493.1 MogA/MoaB family molybdenum cofactor biosynthesis protein [Bacillaceae bacterium]
MSLETMHDSTRSIKCAVITISDTRTEETDKSGKLLQELLRNNGHLTTTYQIVKDEEKAIIDAVEMACTKDISLILMTGGTGIAKRDVTIETVSRLFEKEIVGFGEIFRMLSYTEDIGSAAILSRAAAGVYRDKAIFIMPGSSGAVKLAMEKLILKEIGHVVKELTK